MRTQMTKKKKTTTLEIVSVLSCAIGLILSLGEKFIESEYNLGIIGNVFLAIGLISFLFVLNKRKAVKN